MTKVGTNMKRIREAHGLSQEEIAIRLGTARSTVCRYEKGNRIVPLEIAELFCSIFDIPMERLLEDPNAT